MHSMAGLRRDLGKLASLSGSVEPLDSIGGGFVGEYDEIVEAVTGNGGISMASDAAARAASLAFQDGVRHPGLGGQQREDKEVPDRLQEAPPPGAGGGGGAEELEG